MLAITLALAGCGGAPKTPLGTIGSVQGFAGLVVADEPRAVLTGQEVLGAGGRAADAAVAMAFMLTVTLPSSAGIAGGGLCVSHDRPAKTTQVFEFLPGRPAAGGAVAVPGLPRGLFALHAKSGRLRWEQLLSAAEAQARFGTLVSRAFATDLAAAGGPLGADPAARALFQGAGGGALREGERQVNVELAATIGRLRLNGPGDLHTGQLAQRFRTAANAVGGRVALEDLRDYTPNLTPTAEIERGLETLHMPPAALVGEETIRRWQLLAGGARDAAPAPGARPVSGGTGFVVADNEGSAVACALTVNGPFGTGRLLPGLGVLAAATPSAPRASTVPLQAVIMTNKNVNEVRFVLAGAGEQVLPNALAVAAPAILDERPLNRFSEPPTNPPAGGLVSVISCPKGLPPNPDSCSLAHDPRGHGHNVVVDGAER